MDFSHFLYSSDSIPDGFGFSLFSPLHLFWLFLCAAVAVGCCILYKKLKPKGRRKMLWVMTALLVGDEIWKLVWLLSLGLFTHSYLPFHLCSINIFLILFFALKPNETVGNFLYVICIPTTTAALLFPTWTKLPFWNFMHLHSFSVHILLLVIPLMLTVGGDIKPSLRRLPASLLLLLAVALFAKGANMLWRTNFMFLESVDDGNPLKLFETLWGSHYYGYPILGGLMIAVMYTPILILQKLKKKKAATA